MDLAVELFRHNTMMNRRLVDACRPLTAEQLTGTATGVYGSIGRTLVHIANSQVGYATRFLDRAEERPEQLTEDPFPGFDALAARFALGDALLEEAAPLAAQGTVIEWTDNDGSWRMPVSLFLLQAINHGTEHRSQVATTLTLLGIEPPVMDGWAYFEDTGQIVAL